MKKTYLIAALVGVSAFAVLPERALAYFNPRMGRFLQRDPGPDTNTTSRVATNRPAVNTGFAQRDPARQYADGMNLYQYVTSNPINWVDYSGNRKGKPSAVGREIFRVLPEYQPGLPQIIPSGDEVEININALSLGNKAGGICGELKIAQVQNLKIDLNWTDLRGDGKGCDFYKKFASNDEIQKQMKAILGKKQKFKCARKFLGFGKNYKCCNKAKFDGTYPVEVVIHPIGLTELLSKKLICKLSGSVTATVKVTGEIGTCFEED